MVAQTVRQGTETFSGVRPLNPARDLPHVALLLEEAFRDDLSMFHVWARVPVVRDIGAAIMSNSFMPAPNESLRGFVYEENGHIVGNVTLTLDDNRTARWLISNVAVAEKYRRRGLARQLMLAAIDHARERNARWLILNVRPWNTGAQHLYEALGFETVDTEMHYICTHPRDLAETPLPLRRLKANEFRAAYQLTLDSLKEQLRMFRPPAPTDFALRFEDRLAEMAMDLFMLQSTERWGYFVNDTLTAVVTLHAQKVGTPHKLDIRVLPQARGQVERGLVAAARARLAQFPSRDIQARALTGHQEMVNALADAGFIPTRGLTLMCKSFRY